MLREEVCGRPGPGVSAALCRLCAAGGGVGLLRWPGVCGERCALGVWKEAAAV